MESRLANYSLYYKSKLVGLQISTSKIQYQKKDNDKSKIGAFLRFKAIWSFKTFKSVSWQQLA